MFFRLLEDECAQRYGALVSATGANLLRRAEVVPPVPPAGIAKPLIIVRVDDPERPNDAEDACFLAKALAQCGRLLDGGPRHNANRSPEEVALMPEDARALFLKAEHSAWSEAERLLQNIGFDDWEAFKAARARDLDPYSQG